MPYYKKYLHILIRLILVMSLTVTSLFGGIGNINKASALDTSISEYMDYHQPARVLTGKTDCTQYTEFLPQYVCSMVDSNSVINVSAYDVTNIKYNSVTREFSYHISEMTASIQISRKYQQPPGLNYTYMAYFPKPDREGLPMKNEHLVEGDGIDFNGEPFTYDGTVYPWWLYRYDQTFLETAGTSLSVEDSTEWFPSAQKTYSWPAKTFSYTLKYITIPKILNINLNLGDLWWNGASASYMVYSGSRIPLIKNSAPVLNITTQSNAVIYNESGSSTLNVQGYVQDADNDVVSVAVEVPNIYYKKIDVGNTLSPQSFSVPIDAVEDSLAPGTYTATITAVDKYNFKDTKQVTFTVKNKLKNKFYYLVGTPFEINYSYGDYESDPFYAVRFRYDHDPSFFDNSQGTLPDSGLWRSSMYNAFNYPGWYNAIVQVRDNPKNDNFDEFRMWSNDNNSSLIFLFHRKPTALFSARVAGSAVQVVDNSYDIDHTTASNKGLIAWNWQWRKVGNEVWNDGILSSLPSADAYEMRLRVRDMDGPSGVGVWSDWKTQLLGAGSNLPPVANFVITPISSSYRGSTTITDKSYDPDNNGIDTNEWTIYKNGSQVYHYYGSPIIPPSLTNYGVGNYQIVLRVRDTVGAWSVNYSQYAYVLNNAPIAKFSMPPQVYRDSVVMMENLTPDPDADGDTLSYTWYGKYSNKSYSYAGSNRNQSVNIRNLINSQGISDKTAISTNWEMRLNVSDGVNTSYATQVFEILNRVPTAEIIGPATVSQYSTITYNSGATDGDSSDLSSLKYYWRVTDEDGKDTFVTTKNITKYFENPGVYTLSHWVIDQIGAKSNIANLKITVTPNLAPSITLTSPAGTPENPTVLDAELQGDPLIQWTYADLENDLQEKYRLEFFSADGLLVNAVESLDSTGLLRKYQVPNQTFERFKYFTVYGRVYSKRSWSEVSNKKTFIIDNPPQPRFTTLTDTGLNAAHVPIYRTDTLTVSGTATDADTVKGDSISYKYYLKPSGGTEELASSQSAFTKQFSTNGIFTLRQVVTDSLGLSRELVQNITVANRIPISNITYPSSTTQSAPTVVSTLTPVIKWDYQDDDGDAQQRYKVRIINLTTGAVTVQSGEQTSSAQQWQIPVGALVENQKYAVEAEVYDGFNWSSVSARKYFMVNLLTVQGLVRHTAEWNINRQAYNMNKSGTAENPRGYHVFWAGERFVLQANTTGLPDSVEVNMTGGYRATLHPTDANKTQWTGELYDPDFEKLPDGPVTFTFTAKNEWNTKTDTVTVSILGDWSEYFQSHRIK